jgi:hypothetical protein
MNHDAEHELEQQIGHALRDLPELAAPPGLLTKTMRATQKPEPAPAGVWSAWPWPMRIAFLLFTLGATAAIVSGWSAIEPGLFSAAWQRIAPTAALAGCIWRAGGDLTDSLALVAQHFGKGFIFACLVSVTSSCALCAGLGTLCVRFAQARTKNSL